MLCIDSIRSNALETLRSILNLEIRSFDGNIKIRYCGLILDIYIKCEHSVQFNAENVL